MQGGVEDADAAVLEGFAQPGVEFARGLVEVVALAHGDGDVGLAHEGLPFFPSMQFHEAVAAHEPPKLGGGELLAEDLDGVEGVSRAVADDVAVAGGEAGVVGDGEFGHDEAVLGTGAGRVFVVGVACGQEDDGVESDFVGEGAGDVEVAVVDGVEGAAEKSDVFHGCPWVWGVRSVWVSDDLSGLWVGGVV